MKVDIEGAEYSVFQKMLDDKTIEYVDVMFVEWHNDRIPNMNEINNSIKEQLRSVESLTLYGEMFKEFEKNKELFES